MNNLVKKYKKFIPIVLILLGILSAVFAYSDQTNYINSGINISPKSGIPQIPSPIPTNSPLPTKSLKKLDPPPLPSSTPNPSSTPAPSPQEITQPNLPVSFEVKLSINNSPSFKVSVEENSNQCDVLEKALEQNKISQLNMRYNSNFESNAVYQINNIGKENSVWWVFKVNNISPSKGCSFIKANSNDEILWEYKGS